MVDTPGSPLPAYSAGGAATPASPLPAAGAGSADTPATPLPAGGAGSADTPGSPLAAGGGSAATPGSPLAAAGGGSAATPGSPLPPSYRRMIITGETTPAVAGTLVRCPGELLATSLFGADGWSDTGDYGANSVLLYPMGFVLPESSTLDALAPPAGYTPGAIYAAASTLTWIDPEDVSIYQTFWLQDYPGGARWVIAGNEGYGDAGGLTIAAGMAVWATGPAGEVLAGFAGGGLAAAWAASPRNLLWRLYKRGTGLIFWHRIGPTPAGSYGLPYGNPVGTPVAEGPIGTAATPGSPLP